MILRGYHESSYSEMKSDALEKAISKYIDEVWALTLTIKSIQNIKNAWAVSLEVAE